MNDNSTRYSARWKKSFACCLAALLLVPAGAGAQRTMRGQWYATACGTATLSPTAGSHPGIGIEAGRYTITAKWSGSLRCIAPRGSGSGSFTAAGSWMYRIAADRSRAFNLYGGGGAFLGVDYDDIHGAIEEVISDSGSSSSSTWTQEEDASSPRTAFTYGLEPALEMELFFARKAALVAGVSLPVRPATRQETLSLRASAGVRINF